MPAQFDLIIDSRADSALVGFCLQDAIGNQLAYQDLDFSRIPAGMHQALFDLRYFLDQLTELGQEEQEVAQLGVFIAETVLGAQIMMRLWQASNGQSLRIVLPGADDPNNKLATLLACVPWEIARPAIGQPSLQENNLSVRIEQAKPRSVAADVVLPFNSNEALRVLFVYAEAKGSQPLGMRQERLQTLALFEKEIYPKRQVEAHFLSHGVTRERLCAQLIRHGGYHIIHWSGHGDCGLLEVADVNGAATSLRGADLIDLFKQAEVPLPHLVFLSACNSGDAGSVQSMDDLLALAAGGAVRREHRPRRDRTRAQARDLALETQVGFTGTAHVLRQHGVPTVVAMRYSVGDDYACELALAFYRYLLALDLPRTPATALALARNALRGGQAGAYFDPGDHATPVLYGGDVAAFIPHKGCSTALTRRRIRLNPLMELAPPGEDFVGRTWELASLGTDFIAGDGAARPLALISGLGGMGKTALCAEVLALWEAQFKWVFIFQAKPNPLSFEATLREIHRLLKEESQDYARHVAVNSQDAIYREPVGEFDGERRLQRMLENLLRALQAEPILLVLDNFETQLKSYPQSPKATQALWECQDSMWDRCLKTLGQGLVEFESRVLISSRKPLAVLASLPKYCHTLPLGPLTPAEAALFLRAHPVLLGMARHSNQVQRQLAHRLLHASRFHPLLMDRLIRLAADVQFRPSLLQALDMLESRQGFAQLPALFVGAVGDAGELAYLDQALLLSIDQLLDQVSLDARQLLWVIALSNETVALDLVDSVWQGAEPEETQQMRLFKRWLDMFAQQPDALPQDLQQRLQAIPLDQMEQFQALAAALPTAPVPRSNSETLLSQLLALGLVQAQENGVADANPALTCHELVRERIAAWMERHPTDRGQWTEQGIWLGYADWLSAYFKAMQHQDLERAVHAGSCAIEYCVQAGAFGKLDVIAGYIVSAECPHGFLEVLLPHLQRAANVAPEGRLRRRCLGLVADAWDNAGYPDVALPYYKKCIDDARKAVAEGGSEVRQAWSDLGTLCCNVANSYGRIGDLDAARMHLLEGADAKRKAGWHVVDILSFELSALNIDIKQGRVKQVLHEVETRVAQIEVWWRAREQAVSGMLTAEILARAWISALHISINAAEACNEWSNALARIDAIIDAERIMKRPFATIAITRAKRGFILQRLLRFADAQEELQACLSFFADDPKSRAETLSSMACLFDAQGDVVQALKQARQALAIFEELPDPMSRAAVHHNLAIYLEQGGAVTAWEEACKHRLAALIYRLASGLHQELRSSLHHYSIVFQSARDTPRIPAILRITELLAAPAFAPLALWLRKRGVDTAALQTEIDTLLVEVKRLAQDESELTG